MKYQHRTGAGKYEHEPIPIGEKEIVLTSVTLSPINQRDKIKLQYIIEWTRPAEWDTGELEIIIRRSAVEGPIIYWTLETCFAQAKHKEVVMDTDMSLGVELYYLTVRSAEGRAIINGDYFLTGTIE
jgi:hypothetical protein